MKVKRQVALVPTKHKENALWWSGNKLYINSPENDSRGELNHLYILSDDEIKDGDWGIKTYGMPGTEEIVKYSYDMGNTVKKIIATTDVSLETFFESSQGSFIEHGQGYFKKLPQIHQSFIEYYIEQYNKGNIITEVDIEYETNGKWVPERSSGYAGKRCTKCSAWRYIEQKSECDCGLKLKVNSQNEISIEKDTLVTLPSSKLEEMLIEFACKVYNKNYETDMSFRQRSETMVDTFLKDNSCR